MILAIDVGNTNIVIGCLEGDRVLFSERVSTKPTNTVLEYLVSFKTLLELYSIRTEEISGVILSSVVPPVTQTLTKAVLNLTGKPPLLIGPGIRTGLNIVIDNPAQLGADLIVNAVAGVKYYGYPLIMIDMGTATTISVVDEKRNYVGGVIMPGVSISLNALVSGTAQLPKIGIEAPKKVIGTNTTDCMKSGIVFSQAAALDGMIDRMEDELGYPCAVVATGGLAGRIVPYCRHEIALDDELTLKGLGLIYYKNTEE